MLEDAMLTYLDISIVVKLVSIALELSRQMWHPVQSAT